MTKEVFEARFFSDIGYGEEVYIVADGARDLRREFGMGYRPPGDEAARRGLELVAENVLCLDGSVPREVETDFDRQHVDDLIDSLVGPTLSLAKNDPISRFCSLGLDRPLTCLYSPPPRR